MCASDPTILLQTDAFPFQACYSFLQRGPRVMSYDILSQISYRLFLKVKVPIIKYNWHFFILFIYNEIKYLAKKGKHNDFAQRFSAISQETFDHTWPASQCAIWLSCSS